MYICVCEVQESVSRCKLYDWDKDRHCDGGETVSMLVQRRTTREALRSSEGRAHSTALLREPKHPCFTHRHRQYTDIGKHWKSLGGGGGIWEEILPSASAGIFESFWWSDEHVVQMKTCMLLQREITFQDKTALGEQSLLHTTKYVLQTQMV